MSVVLSREIWLQLANGGLLFVAHPVMRVTVLRSGCTMTYNGITVSEKQITTGGYSTSIVVDHNFALSVPESPAAASPLLCAGITTGRR